MCRIALVVFATAAVYYLTIMAFFVIMKSGDKNEGQIKLPHGYEILEISATNRYLFRKTPMSSEGSGDTGVVLFDIDAVAWNESNLFFHLSNRKNTRHERPPDKRFQILTFQTEKLDTYETLDEAQNALKRLHAESLILKSVADFFPETKKSAPHPFRLE